MLTYSTTITIKFEDENDIMRQGTASLDNPLSDYPLLALTPGIPSAAEVASARTQIRIAEEELYELDFELSLILAKRAHIISRLDRCRNVIAPYKKLPAKLILKIMHLAVPKYKITFPSKVKEDIARHLQITQICTTWRQIAFTESELWDLTIHPCSGDIELAAAWFRQSSCSRLGLAVQLYDGFSELADQQECLLFIIAKAVIQFSRRLSSLTLHINKAHLESILSQSFENLERLCLYVDQEESPHLLGESDLRFRMPTPALRSVTLGVPFGTVDEGIFLGLPLNQITNLELSGFIVAADLVGALKQCSSLQTCTVVSVEGVRHEDGIPVPFTFQHTPILLPQLKHLEIIFACESCILYLLEMPRLFCLVANENISSPEGYTLLQRLSNLRRVNIVSIDPEGFINEEILPSITFSLDVNLGMYPFQPSTLVKIGTGDLLPVVENLEVYENDMRLIVDMLTARALNSQRHPERISQIKSIQIHCQDEEGEERFRDTFHGWRSQEMDIKITTW